MIRELAGKLQQKGYGVFREFFLINKAASLLLKGKQIHKKTGIDNQSEYSFFQDKWPWLKVWSKG